MTHDEFILALENFTQYPSIKPAHVFNFVSKYPESVLAAEPYFKAMLPKNWVEEDAEDEACNDLLEAYNLKAYAQIGLYIGEVYDCLTRLDQSTVTKVCLGQMALQEAIQEAKRLELIKIEFAKKAEALHTEIRATIDRLYNTFPKSRDLGYYSAASTPTRGLTPSAGRPVAILLDQFQAVGSEEGAPVVSLSPG